MGVMVNTVEVNFGRPDPKPTILAVHCWLRSLGLQAEHVISIIPMQQTANLVMLITFKQQTVFQSFLQSHGGSLSMPFADGTIPVWISDATVKEKFVRLNDVLAHIEDHEIINKLQQFGRISVLRREKFRLLRNEEESYFPVFNGTVTVRMKLDKDIPSYLWFGDYRVYVRYSGQPITCMVCNGTGHIGAHCPKKLVPQNPRRWESVAQNAPVVPRPETPTDAAPSTERNVENESEQKINENEAEQVQPVDHANDAEMSEEPNIDADLRISGTEDPFLRSFMCSPFPNTQDLDLGFPIVSNNQVNTSVLSPSLPVSEEGLSSTSSMDDFEDGEDPLRSRTPVKRAKSQCKRKESSSKRPNAGNSSQLDHPTD